MAEQKKCSLTISSVLFGIFLANFILAFIALLIFLVPSSVSTYSCGADGVGTCYRPMIVPIVSIGLWLVYFIIAMVASRMNWCQNVALLSVAAVFQNFALVSSVFGLFMASSRNHEVGAKEPAWTAATVVLMALTVFHLLTAPTMIVIACIRSPCCQTPQEKEEIRKKLLSTPMYDVVPSPISKQSTPSGKSALIGPTPGPPPIPSTATGQRQASQKFPPQAPSGLPTQTTDSGSQSDTV